MEEDLPHRGVDQGERCLQAAPRHIELAQARHRVGAHEQVDPVEPHGVDEGVGPVEQGHAPVAAGDPPQTRRLGGQGPAQRLRLAPQIDEGPQLADGLPEQQPPDADHARRPQDELAEGLPDLLLDAIDRDGPVIRLAVVPVLEELDGGQQEGRHADQRQPGRHLAPPLRGDERPQQEGDEARRQGDRGDAHHPQPGAGQGPGLLLGQHDRHVVTQGGHGDDDRHDRGVARELAEVLGGEDAGQDHGHDEDDGLGHHGPADEGEHVPQEGRGVHDRVPPGEQSRPGAPRSGRPVQSPTTRFSLAEVRTASTTARVSAPSAMVTCSWPTPRTASRKRSCSRARGSRLGMA